MPTDELTRTENQIDDLKKIQEGLEEEKRGLEAELKLLQVNELDLANKKKKLDAQRNPLLQGIKKIEEELSKKEREHTDNETEIARLTDEIRKKEELLKMKEWAYQENKRKIEKFQRDLKNLQDKLENVSKAV